MSIAHRNHSWRLDGFPHSGRLPSAGQLGDGVGLPGRVLIADDEEVFRRETTELVRSYGYECQSAGDCEQAIEMLRAGRYDLMLADVDMPGNGDLRLVREARRRDSGISVILVSNHPTAESAISAIDLPVAAYLLKPLDEKDLRRRVRVLLRKSRRNRTLSNVRQKLMDCACELDDPDYANRRPADDSSTMRKIIIRSLNAIGVSGVVEAKDGSEAVTLFGQGGIDLVLTDWNMPNKTGPEVIREIRQQDASVPIIMVTTEAEKRRVVEAIEAGVTDYLVKPFDADTLKEKVNKYVAV